MLNRATRACTQCILAFSALAAAAPVAQAAEEVVGTWVTTTANSLLATPESIEEGFARLKDVGVNTVYVETWKNGYTQFPSATLQAAIGVDRKPDLLPANNAKLTAPRDLLAEVVAAARKHDLRVIAWFEYGFMAAHKDTDNHLRRMKAHWLTQTKDGKLVSDQNPFVWMNPMHPEAQDLLMGVVLDAVKHYDIDGVQLDDRIAWPVTMGYDDYTVAAYKKEHDGQSPPQNERDPAWVAWRAAQVDKFAARFHQELKAAKPDLLVSISPAVYPWSLENYACDWPKWMARGLMDEYVPQVYRLTYDRFAEDWLRQVALAKEAGRPETLVAGLRLNGEGPDTPWDTYRQMVDLTRTTGTGGHAHWFSRGVLEAYPQQLEAYYDRPTAAAQ